MQEWFTSSIKPYCTGKEGIILRWEGAFEEAKRNHIVRLAMNFGAAEIELVGGIDAFKAIMEGFHRKHCPNTVFEPEITYMSLCNIEEEASRIDQYVSSGYFRSIDVCGGENLKPFEDFLPLYRKAEKYHLIKRMHVGESGTAEDIRKAVDILGLDEVHHGINAANSKEVMRFLADNRIQLNVCPSSNVMLGYARSYKEHPIKELYENGVSVTINTDDLLIFDSSIENEYLLLYREGVLSAKQLNEIRLKGLTGSKKKYGIWEANQGEEGRAKMPLDKDSTKEEVKTLIFKAKSGDNTAWESLYHHFEKYVHSRAWKRLKKLDMTPDRKKDLEEELYQAGWQGFLSAVRNYDPKQGEFSTYATYFIDGKMAKEMKLVTNPQGFAEMLDFRARMETQAVKKAFTGEETISVDEASARGKYSAERRTLQILEILRLLTDETHSLSKEELSGLLHLYRTAKYKNGTPPEAPNTLTSTLQEILAEVDPLEYTGNNEEDYRIRYEGYRENRLKEKRNKEKGKKSADITDFSYVHTFSHAELDNLIQMVSFSDLLSNEEKQRLVDKLVSTSSLYYRTPFYDGNRLKFSPQTIHGRFSTRAVEDRKAFAKKINRIQQAIRNLCQIRFRFNCYTAEHAMMPKTEYLHVLSPYHLVVYHDNYYCIGMKKEDRRIWHYRVDLMSDVEFVTDGEGKPVPINICAFEGLPISNAYWDPEKYMAEHLYMAYDEPREIQIKLRSDDYTILHDWFGDHYEKMDESMETDENGCRVQYDIVKVRTSPSMVVHWAMQYAGAVEILDEEIRERIRGEIAKLKKKYE